MRLIFIIKVIAYEDKYLEDVRDLLVELEEYLISIDKDGLDRMHPDYREKMALVDLEEVLNNHGKCFLAIINKKVVGLIMGIIPEYGKYDYLDYKCPKRGVITELVVSKNTRGKGIGKTLITTIENYFKLEGCEYVLVDVFAYNEKAINFYKRNSYHARMYTNIKKLTN